MKNFIIIAISAVLSACCFFVNADVTVSEAWVRAAPPNAPMAGYMQLKNNTDDNVSLIAAHSPMYSSIEFHRSVEKDGVYRMIRKSSLDIPAHGLLELKPGDYHLMLFNAKQQLQPGETVNITLQFSNETEEIISFDVLTSK